MTTITTADCEDCPMRQTREGQCDLHPRIDYCGADGYEERETPDRGTPEWCPLRAGDVVVRLSTRGPAADAS